MAKNNNIQINLDLNDKDAKSKIKDLTKEIGNTEGALEDTESAGKTMAKAISRAADDTIDEIDKTKAAVDALDAALAGTDYDSAQAVSDLKKLGLTAEEIEADAKELADALKKAGTVETHAVQQGFKDVDQALGSTRDEAARTHSTVANFVGNSVEELPGISGALGPAITGFGQLAEGAAEGEIGIKQLVGAGAGFAAMSFVLDKVQSNFTRIAEAKAWKKEQVEAYTDALKDADSVAEAVADKLRDAEELTFSFGDGLLELDLLPQVAKAGLDVEHFSALVAGGEDTIQSWAEAQREAGNDTEAVNAVVLAATQETQFLSEAQQGAAANAEFFGKSEEEVAAAIDEVTAALEENIGKLEDQLDAQLGAADASYALEKAQFDLTDTVIKASEVFATAEAGSQEYREAELDVIDAANGVAQAEVRKAEETAKAEGKTLSAKDRVDEMNTSLLNQAATLNGPARDALIEHIGQVNNIPASKMTEINAAIAAGNIEEAQRLIDEVSKPVSTALKITVDQASVDYAQRQKDLLARPFSSSFAVASAQRFRQNARGTTYFEGGATWVGEEGPELLDLPKGSKITNAGQSAFRARNEGGGGTTNVYQYFPAGTNARDVAKATREWERRNGPR